MNHPSFVAAVLAFSSLVSSPMAARVADGGDEATASAPLSSLHTAFRDDGIGLRPDDESGTFSPIRMRLASWGRDALAPVNDALPITSRDGRVDYDRGEVIEWYARDARGVEQGFTIPAAPPTCKEAGDLPLQLVLALDGIDDVRPGADGRSLRLVSATDGFTLTYSGLRAWDAEGRPLDARLAYDAGEITIAVEDRAAAYPVTIDPWIAIEAAKLVMPNSTWMGATVAFDGDTAITVNDSFIDAKGWVFTRSGGGWQPGEELPLPSDPSDTYNWSFLALSGDTVAVGGTLGAFTAIPVYVFTRNGTTWSEQAQIPHPPLVAAAGGRVALDGDTLLIGIPYDRVVTGWATGAVYVYERDGTSWNEQAVLAPADATWGDFFGGAVALDGDTAVIGASGRHVEGEPGIGAAFVFIRDGSTWSQQASFPAPEPRREDKFGSQVDVSGDTVVVASSLADASGGANTGACWIFERSGSTWYAGPKLTASDAQSLDEFGCSVALEGKRLVVGARYEDEADDNAGAVYLFAKTGAGWEQASKILASDAFQDDRFGWDVALSGSTFVVGAPEAVGVRGALYAFDLHAEAHVRRRDALGNQLGYYALTRPLLGGTYHGFVLLNPHHRAGWVVGYASPAAVSLPNGRTILVNHLDMGGELLRQPIIMDPGMGAFAFDVPIPADAALAGMMVYTQGMSMLPHPGFSPPYDLSNAQDLFLGYQ